MGNISRRDFLAVAAVLGAEAAWGRSFSTPSKISWRERRDLFPEGVASGDPDSNSVLLWTRRAPQPKPAQELIVEVALDQTFQRVVATQRVSISAEADWTCRVLVGGLKPAQVYWYRFTDPEGSGSRVGRTITAPADDDSRPVHFAFVSCQNANFGAQNAYRRMIFEDEHASEQDRLSFVLHLGDFIYELVWYPEDRATYYDRKVKELVRYPQGEKIDDFHIPVNVDDYRAVYRTYLHDPDLQDARARFPFVPMWDNHEYSWQGWQALQVFDGKARPAQTRKVAAMQVFFEYQPARMVKSGGPSLEVFGPPQVKDAPVTVFDEHGLGQEANNLAAIHSLKGYRSLRWGRNVELMITDERSYRSEDPEPSSLTQISLTKIIRSSCPRRCLKSSMAAGVTTEANRPTPSVSGTSKFRTCVRRTPRRPSSEPSKKRGFWNDCGIRKLPGRSGEAQLRRWICVPTR